MTFSEPNLNNQIAETDPWGDSSDIHQPKIPSSSFNLIEGRSTSVTQINLEKSLPLEIKSNFTREEWNQQT